MSAKTKKSPTKSRKAEKGVECSHCNTMIPAKQQALFVEEEVGRYFCQESCIVSHFSPEIEKMERQYGKHISPTDLSSEERERYAHLRWTSLQEPQEVWKQKTASGDSRYTLITQYKPEQKTVWAVGVCLMLRNEPSFLFIAFVTGDRNLVDVFRKGEKMKVLHQNPTSENTDLETSSVDPAEETAENGSDGLAEPWTESDSVRVGIVGNRKKNDIPIEDFAFYQKCLEETLQDPTELWSYSAKAKKRVYHFIREYEHDANYWYVVMAKDAVDDTQIEIIDAFPTRDRSLIQMCRHGKKESLGSAQSSAEVEPLKRTVH